MIRRREVYAQRYIPLFGVLEIKQKGINMKQKKKEKEKKKLGFFSVLMLFSLMPLILSVGIISTMSLLNTNSTMSGQVKNTLYIVASNLANYCRENEITAINAAEYYDYLDSLTEQDIEMAIIIDGAPCATSIKNENDYRIREIPFEKDISSDWEEIKGGYYDNLVEINEKAYFGYYVPIESGGKVIGMAFAGQLQENVTKAITSEAFSFLAVVIFMSIVIVMIAFVYGRKLLHSFKAVSTSINALSEGDLSVQEKAKSVVKEMQMLIVETGTMQENLSGIIGKVKAVSGNLAGNIVEVTSMSQSSAERARQITSAMGELSATTVNMADNVQDINAQMMEIGKCVNDISDSVEELRGNSEDILQTNNAAKVNIDTIMENSRESVGAVNDIATQIEETNDSIAEIDQAVQLILDISEQTNLLSLNASIEAARAGEAGRGFAVVAEEIRRLSEQSAEGAEMIKNLAGMITEKSGRSVELAKQVHSLILLEQENVKKTQRQYEKLSGDIEQSVTAIRSIAEKTDNLTVYKEKVIDHVQSLSAISEENTASNEEVNENINEIMSEVQTVNLNCEKMNQIAHELEESVAYFHN